MTDTVSTEARSRIMARVKGRDTAPEIALRGVLSSRGYRYRKNYRIGRKTIDIAFVHERVAVFVDGCFWHGCRLHGNRPKSNSRYWNTKINANIYRDRMTNHELKERSWQIIRVWEHQIKKNPGAAAKRVANALYA